MESIIISVIVPVYNAEKYLGRCIDSVLNQTFKEFELILVDDGSKDSSGNICEKYAERDQRIKVIHQENQGQAAARNRGVFNAIGEWIMFVDADDMIHRQMLEYLYRAVDSIKVKLAVCKVIEGEKCPIDFGSNQEYKCIEVRVDETRLLQFCTEDHNDATDNYVYWIACGKLIHRSLLEQFPFKKGRIYEDNAVVFKWLYGAGSIAACNNLMYFYYVNNSGTTKGNQNICKWDWIWAWKEQVKFYKKIKYSKMVDAAEKRFIRVAMREYENMKKYPKNKKMEGKLRRIIVKFLFLERNHIKFSREEMLDIVTRLYPSQIQFLWSIKKKILK